MLFFADVFNTEAHPFQIPPAAESYGTNHFLAPNPSTNTLSGLLPAVSAIPVITNLLGI